MLTDLFCFCLVKMKGFFMKDGSFYNGFHFFSEEGRSVFHEHSYAGKRKEQGLVDLQNQKRSFLVLVVDDCEQLRHAMCRAFEQAGYCVAEAANGDEALRVFKCELPDAVVLDLVMPGMRGEDVLRGIRKINPITPVIVFSSLGGDLDLAKSLEAAGATQICLKPHGGMVLDAVAESLRDL